METGLIAPLPPGAVMVTRTGFGTQETQRRAELQATVMAAQVKAEVEARIVYAAHNPRDLDRFGQRLLAQCVKPGVADIALYHKPVGRQKNPNSGEWEDAFATNFSVRFVETALQLFTNTHTTSRLAYEDEEKILVQVSVVDIESNTGYTQESIVVKEVERKDAKDRAVISQRQNSKKDIVYTVVATPDEMRTRCAAEMAKLRRDCGQKLLPREWLDEARAAIDKTNADENAKDPQAAKKKVLQRFFTLGIEADVLVRYLGKPLDALNLRDLAELGVLFQGLKEGEFTMDDAFKAKDSPAEGDGEASDIGKVEAKKAHALKDRVAQAREQAKAKQTPAPDAEGKPQE
jgi:hypothetical protein